MSHNNDKDILICAQQDLIIDENLIICVNQTSSSIWISPEFTQIFFFTLEEYSQQDNILDIDNNRHHISKHHIGNMIIIIAIEQSAWNYINSKVKKYKKTYQDTYLYYLDLWLLDEAIQHKFYDFSLENVKYLYQEKERIELYGQYEYKSINPKKDKNYIAAKIPKSKADKTLNYLNIIMFCFCLLLTAYVAKMRYLEKQYINIYNQELNMNKKIIGYTKLKQHAYFNDLIEPLTNIKHPQSYINIISANAISNSILIVGAITNNADLQNWSKIRKYSIYKNIDLSVIEYNKQILKLDAMFKQPTDEKYENKSILLIQKPDMISDLDNINITEISKNLFATI